MPPALPELRKRARYKPSGFCSPVYFALIAAMTVGTVVLGIIAGFLTDFMRAGTKSGLLKSLAFVFPLAIFAFGSMAGIKANVAGKVRRWWLVALMNDLFAPQKRRAEALWAWLHERMHGKAPVGA
ncbi:MAG: hypothetical protein PWP23_2842 [Candidatus Sumerlaeota bacterium]|nr:hypothetical protein [Candidatus Sumerlaeota bacterium]